MTRTEMLAYVCNRLLISLDDTDRINVITTMLNQSHRRIVAEIGLLQNRATMSTVTDTPTITLPTDCARIRAMVKGNRPMQQIGWQELANLDLADPAVVTYYVIKSPTQIYLHPTPSSSEAGAITIYYDAYPTAMSAGSSEPEGIPSAYHEIVPESVIARVALAEEEIGLAQASQAILAEMRMRLETLSNRLGGQLPAQQPIVGLRPH